VTTPPISHTPPDPRSIRHRAAALPAEERRQAIIAATLPLVREFGASVTTSQIAQAAGIAEGTIFRVFQDKHELLLAALHSAMSADAELTRIAAIPAAVPLAERLQAAMTALGDYHGRLWSLMRALQDLGWRPGCDEQGQGESGPRRQFQRLAAAVADLLASDAGSLRMAPLPAARMLLALAFSNHLEHGVGESPATAAQLVDFFLHGALREPGAPRA
jgi:AcrR family transcriptional regulator